MLMTVDTGNTNIVVALYEKDKIKHKWRLESDTNKTEGEYSILISQLLEANHIKKENIEGISMSSVVPILKEKLKGAVKFLGKKIVVIGDENTTTNVNIKIDNPNQLGEDAIANTIAGKNRFKENFIIIDFGTATTFSVVGDGGDYIGGVISPGINLALKALSDAGAKLPEIKIHQQEKVIGKNSLDAMNSGVYFGYMGLIKEIVCRIKSEYEYGDEMKIYSTGGLAPIFSDKIDLIDGRVEDLTLEGLKLFWEMNS